MFPPLNTIRLRIVENCFFKTLHHLLETYLMDWASRLAPSNTLWEELMVFVFVSSFFRTVEMPRLKADKLVVLLASSIGQAVRFVVILFPAL